ncbi:hypothetical protein BaRGS_00007728 [Batillaria attramentaria]|uniref:Uncharacterized protein n=1 Tax=Batillaria attramentaria TaxID=370345 RepID=A0ABD0LNQ8_9CAEN
MVAGGLVKFVKKQAEMRHMLDFSFFSHVRRDNTNVRNSRQCHRQSVCTLMFVFKMVLKSSDVGLTIGHFTTTCVSKDRCFFPFFFKYFREISLFVRPRNEQLPPPGGRGKV